MPNDKLRPRADVAAEPVARNYPARGTETSVKFPDLTSALAEVDRLRSAARLAEARERTLVDELQHGVRNMLAAIRSIYRQSFAVSGDREDFAQHFMSRLDAIARYHPYPGSSRATGIEIEDILRDELLSSRLLDGPRCSLSGPPLRLRGKQAELLGLAIHELAMNSVKYGALGGDGRLSVEWSGGSDGLRFRWSEDSVAVAAPAPRPYGFGRQLIEEALPYQLGATTGFEFRPGGIVCVIELPPDPSIAQDAPQGTGAEASPLSARPLADPC